MEIALLHFHEAISSPLELCLLKVAKGRPLDRAVTMWSERETSEEEKALDSVHRCGSLSSVLDLICLGWVLKVQLLIDVGANRLEV